jgi:hypothetical protein
MNRKFFATLGSKSAGTLAIKVAIISTAVIGGGSLATSSVFASLTASATNTSGGSVSTGTLKLTQAPSGVAGITGGFVTAITTMAPGDTINRYVDLTNGGTLDATAPTLGIAAAATALTTDATNGLKVLVSNCTVAWTNAGVCSGTTTVVLAQTAASVLVSAPTAITLPSNLASAVSHLQFSIALPAGTENVLNGTLPGGTIQGLSTAITWTIAETVRTATNTNS